jgi:hypothetical protein
MPGQEVDLVGDHLLVPLAVGGDVEMVAGVVPHLGEWGTARGGAGGAGGAVWSRSATCTSSGQRTFAAWRPGR